MKILKNLNRIKVRSSKGYQGEYLSIWIGFNEVGAYKLGKAVQTPRGVREGRHYSWDSAFLMQPVNTDHDFIWKRDDYWSHKYRKSKKSGRWMWMGLPIEVMTERIDYEAEALTDATSIAGVMAGHNNAAISSIAELKSQLEITRQEIKKLKYTYTFDVTGISNCTNETAKNGQFLKLVKFITAFHHPD